MKKKTMQKRHVITAVLLLLKSEICGDEKKKHIEDHEVVSAA